MGPWTPGDGPEEVWGSGGHIPVAGAATPLRGAPWRGEATSGSFSYGISSASSRQPGGELTGLQRPGAPSGISTK